MGANIWWWLFFEHEVTGCGSGYKIFAVGKETLLGILYMKALRIYLSMYVCMDESY